MALPLKTVTLGRETGGQQTLTMPRMCSLACREPEATEVPGEWSAREPGAEGGRQSILLTSIHLSQTRSPSHVARSRNQSFDSALEWGMGLG